MSKIKLFKLQQHNGSQEILKREQENIVIHEGTLDRKEIKHFRSVASDKEGSPYQMFTYYADGLSVEVAVEATGDVANFENIFNTIDKSLDEIVTEYVEKLSAKDGKAQSTSLADATQAKLKQLAKHNGFECHVSMAVVYKTEKQEKMCTGFVEGNATIVVKHNANQNDDDQLSMHTSDNPNFNMSVRYEGTASPEFRKSVMIFLGVPQSIIKKVASDPNDHTVSNLKNTRIQHPELIVDKKEVIETLPTHYLAHAAIVPMMHMVLDEQGKQLVHEELQNIEYCKEELKDEKKHGTDRSDSSTSSTIPLLSGIMDGVKSISVPLEVRYYFVAVVLISGVLAVTDYFAGDPITNLLNKWTDDHWFDGDIGKHAASGFAFPGALTVAVGFGCLFYYGAKRAFDGKPTSTMGVAVDTVNKAGDVVLKISAFL